MSFSVAGRAHPTLLEHTVAPDYAAGVCAVLQRLRAARDVAECAALLELVAHRLGADAALFTTLVRLDATAVSCRTLLACDPRWGTQCAAQGWGLDDPWVQYALEHAEPCRASELQASGPRQQAFAEAAANHGFRSAVIVPAPSALGPSRIGMLVLGADTPGYFEGEGYAALEVLAWPLATALQAWWHARIRQEVLHSARITATDIALLRYEHGGRGSKQIAAELRVPRQTVDSRFQRLNDRLHARNRKAAAQLARLYGLI